MVEHFYLFLAKASFVLTGTRGAKPGSRDEGPEARRGRERPPEFRILVLSRFSDFSRGERAREISFFIFQCEVHFSTECFFFDYNSAGKSKRGANFVPIDFQFRWMLWNELATEWTSEVGKSNFGGKVSINCDFYVNSDLRMNVYLKPKGNAKQEFKVGLV